MCVWVLVHLNRMRIHLGSNSKPFRSDGDARADNGKKEVSAFISLIRDQKYMVYKLQINVWCAEYVASTSSYMV